MNKEPIELTDLSEIIFLLNLEVPIFMELACNFMHIDDDAHPWHGHSLCLSNKAQKDFDQLCESGAIGGVDTGKKYLEQYCLWDPQIHGEQPEKGKILAEKYELGKEFANCLD